VPAVLLASGNGPAPVPGTGIFKTGRSRTLTINASAFTRLDAPAAAQPCPFSVTGITNGNADGSVSGVGQLSVTAGFWFTTTNHGVDHAGSFDTTIEGAVQIVMEGEGFVIRLGGGVTLLGTVWDSSFGDVPFNGFATSLPFGSAGTTSYAHDVTVSALISKTLAEWCDPAGVFGGPVLKELLAGGAWNAVTTALTGPLGFYWPGHFGNAWQTWSASGSVGDSRNLTLTLPLSGAASYPLGARIRITANGSVSGQVAGLSVSGSGIATTAATSGTSPDGHLAAGCAAGGTMTVNRTAGGLDNIAEWYYEPDWALNWALTNKDYRDGSDVHPNTYLRVDGGAPTPTVVATGTGSLDYPGAGGIDHYQTLELDHSGSPSIVITGHALFGFGTSALGAAAWYACVDEAWADTYSTLLDSANFIGNNKLYLPQLGPNFDLATLRIDSAHDYAWPLVAGNWNAFASQDGAAVRWTPTFGGGVSGATRNLKYFAYRFLQLHCKSDVDNYVLTLRLRMGGVNFFWTKTLGPANVYQTVEFDLGQPDTQDSPERWPLHPGAYGTTGAAVQLTVNATGSLWIDQWHGFQKTGGGRVPLMLLAPLSSRQGVSDLLPRHTVTPATDENVLTSLDLPLNDDTVGSRLVQPGGALFAKLITNGILGADFLGDPGNLSALGTKVKDEWTSLKLALDNDALGNFGGTANDSGIHITPVTAPATLNWQQEAYHRTGYPLAGGGPWNPAFAADSDTPIKGAFRRWWQWGYYGSGAGPGGAYGATLLFTAEKVWNGEIIGNCGKSGASIQLADQDGGAVVASGVSNGDGLYRIPYHYGAVFAYSNLGTAGTRPPPLGTATLAQRQHYTGTPPTSYDSTGQLFNDWRLKASAKWKDGSGFVLSSSGGSQRHAPLFDRYPSWLDILVLVGFGPTNIVLPLGTYLRAHIDAGNIIVKRAEILPPFTMTATALGDGSAADPVFFYDTHWRPHLLVTRGADVHELYSDDDGETWSTPVAVIAGGKYPDAIPDPLSGTILRAALVGANIKGTLQEAGAATAGALFTFVDDSGNPLNCADDKFSLAWGRDGSERLLLTVTISGDAAPSDWFGADGTSWKKFP
jgi:hypothetical protein